MAVGSRQGETVDLAELLDLPEGFFPEGSFAFEGVQYDAFEKISEAKVFEFGDRFQDFEQVLFDADAGLDAFDEDRLSCHGTKVPRYVIVINGVGASRLLS